MIGNDVVDIAVSRKESNWRRKGFLEKIFTREEQVYIRAANDPELYIWILWSMKEAAYKIYNRETGTRAFIPHELACTFDVFSQEACQGTVKCRGKEYCTTTTIVNGIIHSIAVHPFCKDKKVITVQDNVLKDANGLPYILNESGIKILVSKSAHGTCTKTVALFQ